MTGVQIQDFSPISIHLCRVENEGFHISFQDFTGGKLPEMCSMYSVSLICPRCMSVTAHRLFPLICQYNLRHRYKVASMTSGGSDILR